MKTNEFKGKSLNRVVNFIKEKHLIKQCDNVLCAVSGGADSMALIHLLNYLSKKMYFDICACHVNHGIRGEEADRDEQFVIDYCTKNGIPCYTEKIDIPAIAKQNKANVEQTARYERYNFYTKTAIQHKCNKVALGHHLDDQVETVLLNLLRGTNPKGLAGIPVERVLTSGKNKISAVRPLLALTRDEVMFYVESNKLPYVTDSTNANEDYTRNWVRLTLIPLLEEKQPQIKQHILQLALNIEKLQEC